MKFWPHRRGYSSGGRTQSELPPPPASVVTKIKNFYIFHDFKLVDGKYKPELDGDDPNWGRIDVKCTKCGEKRRNGTLTTYNAGGHYHTVQSDDWELY